jgi:ABC-2 type transport system permease protein
MNFSRIHAIFLRYSYALIKGPQQLSDLFYWPLIDIFLWGLTSLWFATQDPQGNVPLFLMSGLIFWQITWRGAIDISISLLQEFWHRNLVNLFSTPLKLSEWVFGISIFSICKLLVTVSFGISCVYAFYGLNIFAIGWAFIPFALILLIFGWSLGLLAASIIIYWGQRVEAIAWMIGYVFAPFSAVFYPINILPAWAQTISWSLPSTYIFEGMRQILHGGPFPLTYFYISLPLALLYFALSLYLFRFSFEKSRTKGLARLE